MEDSTLFRAPVQAPVEPTETQRQEAEAFRHRGEENLIVREPTEVEMPPHLYREAGKMPIAHELIGAQDEIEAFSLHENIDMVDDFINSEIARRELKNNKETYKELFSEFMKKSGADGDIYTRTQKITDWIKVHSKLIGALKEKEELDRKDPMDMTSSQLKKYILGK